MKNIVIIVNNFKRDKPILFWISLIVMLIGLVAAIANIKSCLYGRADDLEKHTPKLVITEAFFYSESIPEGNRTGIYIVVFNQSNAWAKNVMIDFINDDNDNKIKYEKIKYMRGLNYVMNPRSIAPNNKILEGWLPQGPAPTIYQNNDKKYRVDIFIDWESDRGEKYSLVAHYESLADNFKQIRFKPAYQYDTFKDKQKVAKIKKANKEYLPDDMM